MAITPKNNDPKAQTLRLFLYIYEKPSSILLGAQNGKKRGFYSIFVIGGTNFRIMKIGFLAIF